MEGKELEVTEGRKVGGEGKGRIKVRRCRDKREGKGDSSGKKGKEAREFEGGKKAKKGEYLSPVSLLFRTLKGACHILSG